RVRTQCAGAVHSGRNRRLPGCYHGLGLPYGLRPRSADGPYLGLPHLLALRVDLLPRGESEVQMKNRLKVLRAERNWSQADLAGQLEVSRQSVNAIETGKFDPSLPL